MTSSLFNHALYDVVRTIKFSTMLNQKSKIKLEMYISSHPFNYLNLWHWLTMLIIITYLPSYCD